LGAEWRNHLKTYLDAEARWRRQSDDVDALVIHELSTLPPQPWEPHAAGGDWRPALNAWDRDSLTQLDWHYRHVQSHWDSPKSPMLPQWVDHAAQEACWAADEARCAELKYARQRDELEAWYRAGLAAGGDDEGWYRRRREDTWISATKSSTRRCAGAGHP
jgi:hypothetical protein